MLLTEVPDHFKTQEMCNEEVRIELSILAFFPNRFKTQKMCNEAVRNWPWPSFIPDHLRTQETYNKIIQAIPDVFHWISECFTKAAEKGPGP